MFKRVFLIVLDSFGIGAAPDAAAFGDEGANTLGSVSQSKSFSVPNMARLGLFNIDGVVCGKKCHEPEGVYGRLRELSAGKDTTIGHWEMGGIVSENPLPTFPDGFPEEVIRAFTETTGREVLCNRPYSGTQVIRDYGEEHLKTGKLIVYTSADSVFQIAANESIISREELYDICRTARRILTGRYGVGRVIARPFVGTNADNFVRTSGRHDFSLEPPEKTVLDYVSDAGLPAVAIGKIFDIFAGKGITEHTFTSGNAEGMERTLRYIVNGKPGFYFTNLVDFDMLYGHRNDVDGYAAALTEFDLWLGRALPFFGKDDLLIITADHGCDPGFTVSTDHSREYVPVLAYSPSVKGASVGTMDGFGNVGRTVCDCLGVKCKIPFEGFGSALL